MPGTNWWALIVTAHIVRNVALLVLVALRLVLRASKTTVLAARIRGEELEYDAAVSSTATPPFPRLWSHFIDTGRNNEREVKHSK